jgi:hypothetical protein
MNGVILMLFGIWCMIGVLILEVRKVHKVLDANMRSMYIKSALDALDDKKEE